MTAAGLSKIRLFISGSSLPTRSPAGSIDPAVRLREFIELAKVADAAGLDVCASVSHQGTDRRRRRPKQRGSHRVVLTPARVAQSGQDGGGIDDRFA